MRKNWQATKSICDSLGKDDCYCFGNLRYYCEDAGDRATFDSACKAKGCEAVTEC